MPTTTGLAPAPDPYWLVCMAMAICRPGGLGVPIRIHRDRNNRARMNRTPDGPGPGHRPAHRNPRADGPAADCHGQRFSRSTAVQFVAAPKLKARRRPDRIRIHDLHSNAHGQCYTRARRARGNKICAWAERAPTPGPSRRVERARHCHPTGATPNSKAAGTYRGMIA